MGAVTDARAPGWWFAFAGSLGPRDRAGRPRSGPDPRAARRRARVVPRRAARTLELLARAAAHMPNGTPMTWMASDNDLPVYVDRGDGASFTDVDGHDYVDFNASD